MSKAHAVELLQKRLDTVSGDVENLALALDHIPLAIVQAAAYINNRYPRFTVEEYIVALEEHETFSEVLSEGLDEIQQDLREAKKSIILSWRISFEHLYDTHRSAAEILSLASFFNHQGIPESLLRTNELEQRQLYEPPHASTITKHSPFSPLKRMFRRKHAPNKLSIPVTETEKTNNTRKTNNFDNDLNILRNFSFITVTPDGHTFEMHRLVKLAAQVWLKERGQHETWLEKSLTRMGIVVYDLREDDWPLMRVFHPHCKLLVDAQPKSKEANLSLAIIAEFNAAFAYNQAWFREVEAMRRRAWTIRKTHLGERDPDTAITLVGLGTVLSHLHEHTEAEEIFIRALGVLEQAVGKDHEYTLRARTESAYMYCQAGRYEEAEDVSRLALQGYERIHKEGHTFALTALRCLASALEGQGKLKEAENLYRKALKSHLEHLERTHPPQVYFSMWSLAQNLRQQGCYEDALPFCAKAAGGLIDTLGPDSDYTLECIRYMDYLKLAIKQERHSEDAVAGSEHTLDDHVETDKSSA